MTQEKKEIICNALKSIKADVSATLASAEAGTLGKQIDDLDAATSTNVAILAAYDAMAAYRLTTVGSMAPVSLVTEMRAEP